jgi:peptide/nickel transport system ATP-binding protein
VIRAEGLSVPGRLDGASLTVAAGELVVVAGESGAGKSTLARALLALESEASGSVLFDDRELLGASPESLRPLRGPELAMLFQDAAASLTPTMRLGAQLAEQSAVHGHSPSVDEDLERVGLSREDARRYPHELSGGMAQRAALALALSLEPRVLVADEPTTGLDAASRDVVLDRLVQAAARGAAVLVVTHDLETVAPLADRVLGMHAGRLGPPPEPVADPPRSLRRPPPPGEPLLKLEGVEFAYRPGEPVLRGASLSVAPGETLALTGPSGCGKTTLARCAVRLLQPHTGRVSFGATDITSLPERALRPLRPGLQMVFQDPLGALNPRRRVRRILGARTAELLEAVGLQPEHAERRPSELSGGERQRVAIARALATDPRLVVLDEPTSSLDRANEDFILDLLARLRDERDLSLLLIAHDVRVVERLADRACVLREGVICTDPAPEPAQCGRRGANSASEAVKSSP